MRVKILPVVAEVRDGVSRYTASLVAAMKPLGVEVITKGRDYDVLHLVAAHRYDPEWQEAKRLGKRLVVTVHDLIPEHFKLRGPHYSGVAERREVLESADAIIAVSQYTKDDIVATYDIPSEKIHVVHNGVEQITSHSSLPASHSSFLTSTFSLLPSPCLLWVGRRAGYKNFFWFVWAIAPLLWWRNWQVVCTGGQPFGCKERLLIGILGLTRRFTVVKVDEVDLPLLYAESICLVMPSRDEGFGLPVIEAMANGCPVVVPNAHVFPEIAGDAAAYFEPGMAQMMRKQIEACADASFRAELIVRGAKQSRLYSWVTCAEQTKKIYSESVIQSCLR